LNNFSGKPLASETRRRSQLVDNMLPWISMGTSRVLDRFKIAESGKVRSPVICIA
jgi:hypothetical protein